MNKKEARWWIVLAVIAVVYNVVVFALPFPKNGVFVISWLFTMAAMGAQIYVMRTAFLRGDGIKSKFYGFPIAKIGIIYLMIQLLLGIVSMALAAVVPIWLPLVLFVLLAGAAAVGLISADAVREEVERQDEKIEKDVKRMRKFQALTATLAKNETNPEMKPSLEKLAESFRFSDPVSSQALKEIEDILEEDLTKLQEAMTLRKKEEILTLCRKTEKDLAERNERCRLNKNS